MMGRNAKWLTLLLVVVMLGTQLVGIASAQAPFDWEKYKGTQLSLILNKHPYSESLIGLLPDFEKKTGIKVKYEILAEEEYFQKLRLELVFDHYSDPNQYTIYYPDGRVEYGCRGDHAHYLFIRETGCEHGPAYDEKEYEYTYIHRITIRDLIAGAC